jgi:hypothetical protein
MYFPEHDGHGDWRLVGLGFMTESQYDFCKGSLRADIFITTSIGHNIIILPLSVLTSRVLHYNASFYMVLQMLEKRSCSFICILHSESKHSTKRIDHSTLAHPVNNVNNTYAKRRNTSLPFYHQTVGLSIDQIDKMYGTYMYMDF